MYIGLRGKVDIHQKFFGMKYMILITSEKKEVFFS